MKKQKVVIFVIALSIVAGFFLFQCSVTSASELSDNVNEQLSHLDLSELEQFFNDNLSSVTGDDFFTVVNKMLNGEFEFSAKDGINYVVNIFFNNVKNFLPETISIVSIAIFCAIVNGIKSSVLSSSTSDIINFIAIMSVALVLASELISIYQETKIAIENIAKAAEIMSPIILTLMVVAGGNVSAGIYKPIVVMLSGAVINIFLYVILPLLAASFIFNIIADFSSTLKLKKTSEFLLGIIKWIIGIVVVIYGFFITVQGITIANFDGISIKATKYAISNGVPIIGGFLGSGFDLVVAGSILIKNSIGIVVVIGVFYKVLSPVLFMVAINIILKLIAAVTEPISDSKIPEFCSSTAKNITYLIVSLLMVGLMFFVTVLLMVFSANSFMV